MRYLKRSAAIALALTAVIAGAANATTRPDAAAVLSRTPVPADPGWRQQILNAKGPYARPLSVTVEGPAAAVRTKDGLLAEGGRRTTLTTTEERSTRLVLDLGRLTSGYVELGVSRATGAKIRMSYAEGKQFLSKDGDADPDPDGFFHNGRTLSLDDDPDGRADVFAPPRRPTVLRSAGLRGSQRFIAITLDGPGSVTIDFLRVRQTNFRGSYSGHFLSSDDVLNKAWYASAYGLDLSTIRDTRKNPAAQWVTVDGPKRDRIVYAGDIQVVALGAYYQGGEYRKVMRDTINLFACQQRPDGTFPAASVIDAPCTLGDPGPPDGSPKGFEPPGESGLARLDSFTAWWVIEVADYLRYSGDREFVRSLLPVTRRAVQFFTDHSAANGLFRTADYDGAPAFNWHPPTRRWGSTATATWRTSARCSPWPGWRDRSVTPTAHPRWRAGPSRSRRPSTRSCGIPSRALCC